MAHPRRDKCVAQKLREELAMSRSELGEEIGSSYRTIYGIEVGIDHPSDDFLAKLARYFTARLGRWIQVDDLRDCVRPSVSRASA